ncbi:hypothetical protein CAPTEDRAFT_215541 [Capitella teleta]|uniref:SEC7 domain-containing protein n=1 Tax=Capitella teleta TaxID=283909 RepID=R7T9X3_CAPTE|nr:hypothetical protein CAPTEDRAFT_215541 [Capitella teleta]|eukprot:ELT87809.1 hypothetical protein CAPTEDRAFT_215541 [Capitella teleta]
MGSEGKVEDILSQLTKDATGNKHAALRQACQDSLAILNDKVITDSTEPCLLRAKCLVPFQLALESRSNKLALIGLSGVQRMLHDSRFQSSIETQNEELWLPMQVLQAVAMTPSLPEDVQVEVMKVLLNMAFSSAWCMNARVITKIAELCFSTYLAAPKQGMRKVIIKTLLRILEAFSKQSSDGFPSQDSKDNNPKVVLDAYRTSLHGSVRTAVRVTLNQLLTAIAERLHDSDQQQMGLEESDDVLAEFCPNEHHNAELHSLSQEVVTVLTWLCEKLSAAQMGSSGMLPQSTVPLLLDGVQAILSKVPKSIQDLPEFVDLIWQQLCPSVVGILGNPLADKTVMSQKSLSADEVGRGSGCSTSAPNIQMQAAKAIYGISVELVRLLGHRQTLRPVLESVFHRMLLYPPPVHRLEAIRSLKELLSSSENLLSLAGPTQADATELGSKSSSIASNNTKRKHQNCDLALLKLIIDSVQECCHCNDSTVCITCVDLVVDLLSSVERLAKGEGLTEAKVKEILWQYREEDSIIPTSPPNTQRDFTDSSEDSDGGLNYHVQKRRKEQMLARKRLESLRKPSEDSPDGDEMKTFSKATMKLHNEEEIGWKYKARKNASDFERLEKRCAQKYIQDLTQWLPDLLTSYSTIEANELIQKFASEFCDGLSSISGGDNSLANAILNADGVYLATYSALSLNLKLIMADYYDSDEKSLPIAESQFVDEVLHTGLLVYLTPTWLAEVFHQVINVNLLKQAGLQCNDSEKNPVIQLLTDLDGLGSRKNKGQMLCVYQEIEKELEGSPQRNTPAEEAGQKFARRIMLTCWDGILDVLSVLVNGKAACGITSSFSIMLNSREESWRARQAICSSLDGLQKAAKLSSVLGLQDRCGAVFAQLANASCVSELEEIKREMQQPDKKTAPQALAALTVSKPKLVRLHAAHALSMDVVLDIGMEMGSHAADCWLHVFRCCSHVSELEHVYFSSGKNQSTRQKIQRETATLPDPQEDLELGNLNGDYYSTVLPPEATPLPVVSMAELLQQSNLGRGIGNVDVAGGGILPPDLAAKVLCNLSQEVDKLYEDAASKLSLKALIHFSHELCRASQHQLSSYGAGNALSECNALEGTLPTNALHIYRLGDFVLRCIRSGRPLLHIMHVWSVVAPHFVDAANHRDHTISKKAVNCIHDVVTTLLSNQPELPHFQFNESLCKPFENLLCLELCTGDIQDQIVCSICELVEACTTEIKSGWRPLFGALRAVKIEYTADEAVNEARQRHVAAVLDVFDVFLNTDNVLVFANAAIDCILCLLKYVRGPGEFENEDDRDSDLEGDEPNSSAISNENLCLPALEYLTQCCSILASMWSMPACPVFDGAIRIKEDGIKVVDPCVPNFSLTDLHQSRFINNAPSCREDLSATQCERYVPVGLDEQDKNTGALHVWFLILEGLSSIVAACPKDYQPQTLDTLFSLMRSAAQVPGPEFVLHCANHLLLPMLQNWLRRGNQIAGYWDSATTANFKQCVGLCTDLVVEYIIQFAHIDELQIRVEFMLNQCLDVLCEIVAQPLETLSRIGCACIRHCLVSSGPLLTESMWYTAAKCLKSTCDVTLYCLHQLMMPFHAHSDNFYGDIGQVFLLESQRGTSAIIDYEAEGERSYIFLIYPPGGIEQQVPESQITRVPFRSVVVGLLSHQLLMQTIGCLLLQDSQISIKAENSLIRSNNGENSAFEGGESCAADHPPGMMRYLSTRSVLLLLSCLYDSYKMASEFDARPGLKFLIQKVAKADVACNMYKQAGMSFTFYLHALMEICIHQKTCSLETTKAILMERNGKSMNNELSDSQSCTQGTQDFNGMFLQQMKDIFREMCTLYVDMYLDKEGPNAADRLSSQTLVFLLVPQEEIPTLKRDRSLREMVAEKLRKKEEKLSRSPSVEEFPEENVNSSSTEDDSPVHRERTKSEAEDKVYTVATDATIKSLMSEYKKRKQVHSMPTFVKATRSHPAPPKYIKAKSSCPGDRVIEDQQQNSIMKDSEARLVSWIEMVCNVLQLLLQLSDCRFKAMLPVVSCSISQLICYSKHPRLREVLAAWNHKLSHLYGYASPDDVTPPKCPDRCSP